MLRNYLNQRNAESVNDVAQVYHAQILTISTLHLSQSL